MGAENRNRRQQEATKHLIETLNKEGSAIVEFERPITDTEAHAFTYQVIKKLKKSVEFTLLEPGNKIRLTVYRF